MDTVYKLYSDMNEFSPFRSKQLPDFIQISFYLQFISVKLLLQMKRGKKEQDELLMANKIVMNKYTENIYLVA